MSRMAWWLVVGVLALPHVAQVGAQVSDIDDLAARIRALPPSLFEAQSVGVRGMQPADSSKLDPRLRQLVNEARQGTDISARAIEFGAAPRDLRLPVLANVPNPAAVVALEQEIFALGGDVTASYDSSVWAMVPPGAIDRLALSPNVHYLSVQDRMDVEQASTTVLETSASQRATRVEALHEAGIRGRGVKIGIIDAGFGGYTRLRQAGKVGMPKAVRSFPAQHPLENTTVHGTACAEIIFAMAPEADIYLAAVESNQGSTIAAAQWLVAQGVDIISYSMGSFAPPSDGSGDLARFVDTTITESGVVWVVGSGNHGASHWSGVNRDTDGDGLIETDGKDSIGFRIVPRTDEVKILVRWDDWGVDPRRPSSSQDIDAYLLLFPPQGSSAPPEKVAESVDRQAGGPGRPVEQIAFRRAGLQGRTLALVLKNTKVNRQLDVHVFVDSDAEIYPRSAAGSVTSPASARYAVAVGAWDMRTNQLAPYSGQGPTDDNRLKPEITAPTGVSSLAYGRRFDGTSASCPHAAGFAALVKQVNPSAKGLALRAAVVQAVEPKGLPVPNTTFGFGWIDGERVSRSGTSASASPWAPSTLPPAPPGGPAVGQLRPAAGASPVVVLPLAWGGTVAADLLDRLRQPVATPADFLIRVVTGQDLYRVGDGLKVGFRTSEDCDYLLLHRSSAGQYTVLSPRADTVATLTAGGAYVLPPDDETFEVTPPTGTEELLLVCSRRAFDLGTVAGRGGSLPPGFVVARHTYQVSP